MKHGSNKDRMTVGPEMRQVYPSTAHQVFVAILLEVWVFFFSGWRSNQGQKGSVLSAKSPQAKGLGFVYL